MATRRVYIVDDDAALRRMISRILAGISVECEEFATAEAFLADYSQRPAGCVLLDVRLPGMDGLELLDQIGSRAPANVVIMLSGFADIPSAVRAVKTGAIDFLQKPFRKANLLSIVEKALATIETEQVRGAEVEALTPREREVLQAFSDGAQNKVVAHRLALSPRTVEMHRARIFNKLGVDNLSQALFRARDARLIDPSKAPVSASR